MKSFSPAAERNRAPILAVLQAHLPDAGRVLEVGSGTGQHIAHFASKMARLTWQPSDLTADRFPSIQSWVAESGAPNVLPPIVLDAAAPWDCAAFDAVYCANVIHISPWSVSQGLFAGASTCLRTGQRLVLYGPFRFGGRWTAASNRAFHERLRQSDPQWGVRDVDALRSLAIQGGLEEKHVIECPANNHCIVYEKTRSMR
ncbi:MAG: DUF938 domain-containing protein [Myxococcota bacterium]|nr:DUF938 domain-containing protein [Myxococcota bacterium]